MKETCVFCGKNDPKHVKNGLNGCGFCRFGACFSGVPRSNGRFWPVMASYSRLFPNWAIWDRCGWWQFVAGFWPKICQYMSEIGFKHRLTDTARRPVGRAIMHRKMFSDKTLCFLLAGVGVPILGSVRRRFMTYATRHVFT